MAIGLGARPEPGAFPGANVAASRGWAEVTWTLLTTHAVVKSVHVARGAGGGPGQKPPSYLRLTHLLQLT